MPAKPPSRETFSDEELAVALLSPCLPYSPRAVRVGAQMLGSRRNQPLRLTLLARREQAGNVVRHIATAGQQTEPKKPSWPEMLVALSPVSLDRSALPLGVSASSEPIPQRGGTHQPIQVRHGWRTVSGVAAPLLVIHRVGMNSGGSRAVFPSGARVAWDLAAAKQGKLGLSLTLIDSTIVPAHQPAAGARKKTAAARPLGTAVAA